MHHSSDVVTFLNHLPSLVSNILKEYNKPIFENKYFRYKEYLSMLNRSTTVKFDKSRWELRPHMFCYDEYGEDYQYVYPVVLTVNNIKSLHDFLPDSFKDTLIIKPDIKAIQTITDKM